MTAPQQTAQTD